MKLLGILLQDFVTEQNLFQSIMESCSYSEGAKKTQIITLPFDCWSDVLFLKCFVSCIPDVMRCKPQPFVSSVHRPFTQNKNLKIFVFTCWYWIMNINGGKCGLHFFLDVGAFDIFVVSWVSCLWDLGVILVGSPLHDGFFRFWHDVSFWHVLHFVRQDLNEWFL